MTTSETMDRGSDALKNHVANTDQMQVRQTRRGWCRELMGCEAKTEMKYFVNGDQVASSLEDSGCCCRTFCSPNHAFKMVVKELRTNDEMLTVKRPCRTPMCCCKCCCRQEMKVSSGGQYLGKLQEDCYLCVPTFRIYDADGKALYKMHQPTCCGGCCVNCCAEGNPCRRNGCCKESFNIFEADQKDTHGPRTECAGQVMKTPKSFFTEVFTEADAFDIKFPVEASPAHKGLVIGSSLFINALFFEGQQPDEQEVS